MNTEEVEEYLELSSRKIREHIRTSHEEYLAAKARPAGAFLAEVKKGKRVRSNTARRRKA